jgi:hypothetical protein
MEGIDAKAVHGYTVHHKFIDSCVDTSGVEPGYGDGGDNAGANAEFLDGKCVSSGRSGCKAEQKWDE